MMFGKSNVAGLHRRLDDINHEIANNPLHSDEVVKVTKLIDKLKA